MHVKLSQSIQTPDGRNADAVIINNQGEWLAELDWQQTDEYEEQIAMPLTDEGGDFIPAPKNWRSKAAQ